MPTGPNLCFDVMMMTLVFLAGAAVPWLTYRVYQAMVRQLGEGPAAAGARKALNSMTGNAMVALGVGVTLGASIASVASTSPASKWMAAAAALWVAACPMVVVLKLIRLSPEPLNSR